MIFKWNHYRRKGGGREVAETLERIIGSKTGNSTLHPKINFIMFQKMFIENVKRISIIELVIASFY